MNIILETVTAALVGIVVYMSILYIISLIKKDASIVDLAWGPGFMIVAFIALALSTSFTWIQVVITTLVSLWGMRLTIYLFLRGKRQKEDFRYRALRRAWGTRYAVRSFFKIFMLQGLIVLIIAYPIFQVNLVSQVQFISLAIMGMGVWIVGFVIESFADYQHYRFRKQPKNSKKFITTGLWRHARHPNYFGEILVWWGLFLIAASVKYGLLSIMSPLFIMFLLIKVTGIPLLEKKYAGNKAYQQYKKKTNALIPLPKKYNPFSRLAQ